MSEIIITTLNAKYIHASFGLRYLLANLNHLKERAEIIEFEITDRALEVCEEILLHKPKIVGFGVYIWNVTETLKVVKLLKKVAPQLIIVLGGPEISYETDKQEVSKFADYIITGEADHEFRILCETILNNQLPQQKIIRALPPEPETLTLPYSLYSDNDINNRIVYVEASRGCPFSCEFCLSSLEIPVRAFSLEKLLPEFKVMLDRGVKHFKFVDRTFNLNIKTSLAILNFFLDNFKPGLFVHFEMVPDRLPTQLRDTITKFPEGTLQFEVGIQSFNTEVSKLISRRQDYDKLSDNISFLRQNSGVHIHADLIVGLPGEDLESFGHGFDRLVALGPQEIQVGILKRLRGTPIVRHDNEWGMVYSDDPPYEILSNKLIDFQTMQKMQRFQRYWDLVANSGNFTETVKMFWLQKESPFNDFFAFSEWLYKEIGQRHGIALSKLTTYIWRYLTSKQGRSETEVASAISLDYSRCNRKDLPDEIGRVMKSSLTIEKSTSRPTVTSLKRQSRHFSQATSETVQER